MKVSRNSKWEVEVPGTELTYIFHGETLNEVLQDMRTTTKKLVMTMRMTMNPRIEKYCAENARIIFKAMDELQEAAKGE